MLQRPQRGRFHDRSPRSRVEQQHEAAARLRHSSRRGGLCAALLTVLVSCNQLLGNASPDGVGAGGQSGVGTGGVSSGGTVGQASGGTVGVGGAPTSGGASGSGGAASGGGSATCEPACSADQVCVGGSCQFPLSECVGQAVDTAVCSEDGSERFVCGEALAVKEGVMACPHFCRQGACVTPPSCEELADDCGTELDPQPCCKSPLVPGGAYFRDDTQDFPATVSDFRLDQYEVTVGRFRTFVDAVVVEDWFPAAGSGKHTHLRAGLGLVGTSGEGEPGWDVTWNAPAYGLMSTAEEWNDLLTCGSDNYFTWTELADQNEVLPINCVNWYQAAAFCIWDGGFLPSEAEWAYVALGGELARIYPWGTPAPAKTNAVYDCQASGGEECSFSDISRVGSVPLGDGVFGQSDLGGSMYEWKLDWYASFVVGQCDNCTNTVMTEERAARGGSWLSIPPDLANALRNGAPPADHSEFFGVRCARVP